jgi:hypothetical protein
MFKTKSPVTRVGAKCIETNSYTVREYSIPSKRQKGKVIPVLH